MSLSKKWSIVDLEKPCFIYIASLPEAALTASYSLLGFGVSWRYIGLPGSFSLLYS